jgi:hypothetical protein
MPSICIHENCRNRCYYGFPNKVLERCKEHKLEGMVTNTKRCECGNHGPNFNYPNETKSVCCRDCKKEGMIDIRSRLCLCGKHIPNFNYPNETRGICCSECKKEGMIDVKNPKCECGKAQPHFNYPNEKKPICCTDCKKDGMIDINNLRCPNCVDWPDAQRANKKYKNYCSRCFEQLFPNDPLTLQIRCKTKEIATRDYINATFDGFRHDQALWLQGCDCTHKRRIDHRKLICNTMLCIETDETQHKYYNKQDELNRYHDCFMALGCKFIFIRFNPDKYKDKHGKSKCPNISTRLFKLKDEIEKQMKRIAEDDNNELLEVKYLYYDEN